MYTIAFLATVEQIEREKEREQCLLVFSQCKFHKAYYVQRIYEHYNDIFSLLFVSTAQKKKKEEKEESKVKKKKIEEAKSFSRRE